MEFGGNCCPGLDVCVGAVGPPSAPTASGSVSQSGGKFLLLEFSDPLKVPKGKVARKHWWFLLPYCHCLIFEALFEE